MITGTNFISGNPSAENSDTFQGLNPATGQPLPGDFHTATSAEIQRTVAAASEAFPTYAALGVKIRARFLELIAEKIEAAGEELLERAHLETALPMPRLIGERGRTMGQLRMFAALLREGSWVDARLDSAQPDRTPLPRPDIRRMLQPLGPVAVFGASNFPFAYSVAGGDTASALAAGCPVIVKAHPAHPGTSELTARAIVSAIEEIGVPAATFGMVHGAAETGVELVKAPALEAVGFTGSLRAGRALFNLAAARPKPIPVYAEMGSVNPIFVLPGALEDHFEALAAGYTQSLTQGLGQFCTNPGLLFGIGKPFERLLSAIGERLQAVPAGVMLTASIQAAYTKGCAVRSNHPALRALGGSDQSSIWVTSADKFIDNPELADELFGPAAIGIVCDSFDELLATAKSLPGQLTATIWTGSDEDEALAKALPLLVKIAGRVIQNGFPTGVEVSPSMQHGGPYPASTDLRTTSVGTAAILRFVRPVAYQGFAASALPLALRDGNPLGIWRTLDGALTEG